MLTASNDSCWRRPVVFVGSYGIKNQFTFATHYERTARDRTADADK